MSISQEALKHDTFRMLLAGAEQAVHLENVRQLVSSLKEPFGLN